MATMAVGNYFDCCTFDSNGLMPLVKQMVG